MDCRENWYHIGVLLFFFLYLSCYICKRDIYNLYIVLFLITETRTGGQPSSEAANSSSGHAGPPDAERSCLGMAQAPSEGSEKGEQGGSRGHYVTPGVHGGLILLCQLETMSFKIFACSTRRNADVKISMNSSLFCTGKFI